MPIVNSMIYVIQYIEDLMFMSMQGYELALFLLSNTECQENSTLLTQKLFTLKISTTMEVDPVSSD